MERSLRSAIQDHPTEPRIPASGDRHFGRHLQPRRRSGKGIPQYDRIGPVRPGGNNIDRRRHKFFDTP